MCPVTFDNGTIVIFVIVLLMLLTAAGVWIWGRRRGISRSADPTAADLKND